MPQAMRRKTIRDTTLRRMLGVVSIVLVDAPRDSHARRASHLAHTVHKPFSGLRASLIGQSLGHDVIVVNNSSYISMLGDELAVEAVSCELVSAIRFLAIRENYREFSIFREISRVGAPVPSIVPQPCSQIPYSLEQGNFWRRTANFGDSSGRIREIWLRP